MCGFVACSDLAGSGERLVPALQRATRSLDHRGPDDEAYYISPSFSAGFRRLKIIDLSDRARQPMSDETERYWIVFNGEIYNYRELRSALEAAGWSFKTESDTEVLLKSYIHWGNECLEKLNGMFAFLVWDARERRLFGARDRFGEKPLFYARTANGLCFASEIKALIPLIGKLPATHAGAIRRYVDDKKTDCCSQSFFQTIHSLPAAHKFVSRDGQLLVSRYWDLPEEHRACEEPVQQFRDVFLDSMRLRLRSDVPLGTCLSGGLDSGAIVCSLAQLANGSAKQITRKTFTAAYAEFDETAEVDAVNVASGSVGHRIVPKPQGLDELSDVLWYHDEPFHSFAVYASFHVMRLAREHGITVLLNGQGADETLAGYSTYTQGHLRELLCRGHWIAAWRDAATARWFVRQNAINMLAAATTGNITALLRGNRIAGNLRKKLRSSTESVKAVADRSCLTEEFVEMSQGQTPADTLSSKYPEYGPLKRQLCYSTTVASLPLYLRVEDRNSMAHSIESRLPFLDHRLVELAFSLPAPELMRGGQNKSLLRRAMKGILPDAVRLRKQKFGFNVPVADWMFVTFREEILDLFRSSHFRQQGVFDGARLERRFVREAAQYQVDPRGMWRNCNFWFRVISVELWLRGLKRYSPNVVDHANQASPHSPVIVNACN